MSWTWRYETADGAPVEDAELPQDGFPSQADAESWLGEVWRELIERGVSQVTLVEDSRTVYGPMSLHAAE